MNLKTLGITIEYLPATEEPLSADVFCIHGTKCIYFYDVGRTDEAYQYIQSQAGEKVVILSHFHGDHIENMSRLTPSVVYGGNKTIQKVGYGTVVREALPINDGVSLEIIPCPSVHASGTLILNVNREYCLIGDLIYFKPTLNVPLANEMRIVLSKIDTKYFIMSHEAGKIWERDVFLQELNEMIEEGKNNECTN